MVSIGEALEALGTLSEGLEGFDGWQAGYLYGAKFFDYESNLYTLEITERAGEIEIHHVNDAGSTRVNEGIDDIELALCRLGVPSAVAKQAAFLAGSFNE